MRQSSNFWKIVSYLRFLNHDTPDIKIHDKGDRHDIHDKKRIPKGCQSKLMIKRMHDKEDYFPHFELTGTILGCCFEVMRELGPGFHERIYKNALLIVMKQKGLQIEIEKPFEVIFRNNMIGRYNADLVVEKTVIIELKCCECLISEHQAQLFNYLKVSKLPIGLLINFRHSKLEYQRLHRLEELQHEEENVEDLILF